MNIGSFFLSDYYTGGHGNPQTGNYAVYIPYMIRVMLFFNFLDVKIQFRRSYPRVLLIALFLSAVAIPGFVYYILSVFFTVPYRTGRLLVACAPTGITTLVLGRYIVTQIHINDVIDYII